jgi:small subunit ribosomal protein S3
LGQKTNPIGFRIGITKNWHSRWFTKRNQYSRYLSEDIMLRKYLEKRLKNGALSTIEIERTKNKINIILRTSRPGVVIGKRGAEVDKLREEVKSFLKDTDVHITIEEIKYAEIDSVLVAKNIARQLESRISYRRAMKKAIQGALKMGAQGIKVMCSGRIGGAEIARTEWYREGRVPLHTLKADIDYATYTAFTMSGTIGIKVWIYKGDILDREQVFKKSIK